MGCSHRLDVLLAASLLALAPAALTASPPPAPAPESSAGRASIVFDETMPTDEGANAPADESTDESALTREADLPAPSSILRNPRFLTPEDLMPRSNRAATAESRAFARITAFEGIVPPESLLPPAIDPNDLLLDPFTNPIRMGDARAVQPLTRAADIPGGDAYVYRLGADVNWSGIYDTGYVAGPWTPLNIALDGSTDAHRQGNFVQNEFGGKLRFDLQNGANPNTDAALTQGFVEMRYFGQDVSVRRLYGRLLNDDIRLAVDAGKLGSLWYDPQGLPRSIIQGESSPTILVGATGVDNAIGFRLTSFLGDQLQASISAENPDDGDVATPDVTLSRWPNLLGRIRYNGLNGWDTYQISGLLRPFGVEDPAIGANSNESWEVGWGLSAMAHARVTDDFAFYAGAAGGNGIGTYLTGMQVAAAGGAGMAVSPLSGLGAFLGLSCRWCESADGTSMVWSNFAYGYSLQESNPLLPADTIRKAQEAWCNLLYTASENAAFGVEYHYGQRDVRDGTLGDDHRILIVLQLSTGGSNSEQAESRTARLADPRREGGPIDRGPAATTYLRRL